MNESKQDAAAIAEETAKNEAVSVVVGVVTFSILGSVLTFLVGIIPILGNPLGLIMVLVVGVWLGWIVLPWAARLLIGLSVVASFVLTFWIRTGSGIAGCLIAGAVAAFVGWTGFNFVNKFYKNTK